MTKPSFQLNQSHHLWFEIFDKPYEDGHKTTITSNYDYEALPDGTKWVYIDLGITLNYCSNVYRCGFEFNDAALSWKDIFVFDMIKTMLEIAFAETQKGYILFCEVNKLELPARIELPETLLVPFANTIIEQYVLYRSVDDKENAYLLNNIVLEAGYGSNTYSLLIYTFDILHEVLFYHPDFRRENNREIFNDIIPLPRYFTLKYKCKEIERGNVDLNGVDTVYLFQCLDCALQMLVSDKSDSLISVLEPRGFDAEAQAEFISSGTEEFNNLSCMLQESNARILNLEDRVEWMKILK